MWLTCSLGFRRILCAITSSAAILSITLEYASAAESPGKSSQKASQGKQAPNRFLFEQFESKSLHENALGESSTRYVLVYLPPSYHTHPERRFPVIYFLHGHGGSPAISADLKGLDTTMNAKGMQEFIIVEPTSANTFYTNSSATGNWEDFIIKDTVEWVDTHFRTIATASSRGIGGFSMGGFGAISLALRHPDMFQAVMAIAPGLIDNQAVKTMKDSWEGSIANDYGAAFSPDPSNPKLGQIPTFDGTSADNRIIRNWENGFGNLEGKVEAYKALNKPLAGIALQVGNADFGWLFDGSTRLNEILNREGIPHRFEVTKDFHSLRPDFATTRIVPFFSLTLKGSTNQ